jgi:hypothetical protein
MHSKKFPEIINALGILEVKIVQSKTFYRKNICRSRIISKTFTYNDRSSKTCNLKYILAMAKETKRNSASI